MKKTLTKAIICVLSIVLCVGFASRILIENGLIFWNKYSTGTNKQSTAETNVAESNTTAESEDPAVEQEIVLPDDVHLLEEALTEAITLGGYQTYTVDGEDVIYGSGYVEYLLKSIEYLDSLPDGMYLSDGNLYSEDGTSVGGTFYKHPQTAQSLSNFISDGTGNVIDGYTLVVVDIDATRTAEEMGSESLTNDVPISYLSIIADIPYYNTEKYDEGNVILWSSNSDTVIPEIGETVSFECLFVVDTGLLNEEHSLYLLIQLSYSSYYHDGGQYIKLT